MARLAVNRTFPSKCLPDLLADMIDSFETHDCRDTYCRRCFSWIETAIGLSSGMEHHLEPAL
jgi:hypothetical protein